MQPLDQQEIDRRYQLPPMFYHPIRIVDELESEVILSSEGDAVLWKRVMNQEVSFSYDEVCRIYEMLGQRPPSVDQLLAILTSPEGREG